MTSAVCASGSLWIRPTSTRQEACPLADLAAGLDALISALRDESGDDESVVALQPIWVGIEIVNALCLDEGRGPTQNEDVEVRQDVARIRDVAAARLEQSA